ncbi:MAG: winged helix-turn-helix transcriptional regulator [Lachnospiraceae bacterium]|nr:winged helix-turn-helix transcriptional regulator [Lachnospiraceae bacterium]
MVNRFERFTFAMSKISKCWHKLTTDEMAKYGLKGPHSVYLIAMYRHEDGITAPQLCDICGKDKADVSRMMSIMEKKGLVTKEGSNQNRYGGVWKLTPEGKAAAEYVRERARLAVELGGKGLTEEDRAAFYRAMELIVSNLQKMSEEGLPPQ